MILKQTSEEFFMIETDDITTYIRYDLEGTALEISVPHHGNGNFLVTAHDHYGNDCGTSILDMNVVRTICKAILAEIGEEGDEHVDIP